jgi:hypothetical protein
MSTRGLTGVTVNQKNYLSYNHSDSYPSYLLQEMAELVIFLRDNKLFTILKENIPKLKEVQDDAMCTPEQLEKYAEYDGDLMGHKVEEYYNLLRNLQGAEWIKQTALGNLDIYINSNDFIKNSLHCEWAYIINLDTNQLEVYKGNQTQPDKNNKFGQGSVECYEKSIYYPCKLITKLDFKTINMSQIEAVINTLKS